MLDCGVVMNILISIEKFFFDNLQLFLQKLSVKTFIFKKEISLYSIQICGYLLYLIYQTTTTSFLT